GADARRPPRGRPERPRDRSDGGPGVGEVKTSILGRLFPVLASLALLATLVASVAAAGPTFGTPTATSKFGTGIDFSQPVTVDEPIVRADLLLTIANAIGPNITEVPFTPVAGSNTLTYTLDTSGQHHMTPNTPIKARWRVFPQSDPEHGILGPEVKVVYADDRFDWKTVSGDLVRVHWYEGDDTF